MEDFYQHVTMCDVTSEEQEQDVNTEQDMDELWAAQPTPYDP